MKTDRRTVIKTTFLSGLGLLLTGSRGLAQNCLTTPDIVGPYYIAGSPERSILAPSGAPGTMLFITGSVYANDCTTPIKDAVVDVWHANDAGGYHNSDYRGIIKTDASGKYAFETILPGKYLNGSQYRPRHLHYKVSAPGIDSNLVLTTQIYFEGDTSIPNDPWASDPDAEERIIPLTTDQNNAEHGVADFVINIDPSQTSGLRESGPRYNGINSIHPNPVIKTSTVSLTFTNSGMADLLIYNINGQVVNRLLNNALMTAGLHELTVEAQNHLGLKLSPGVYILKLFVDNIATDAKRFVVAG